MPRIRLPELAAGLVLGFVSIALGLWLYGLVRQLIFMGPEWQLAVERRAWSPGELLKPWQGAPGVVPVSLYNILFAWKGMLTYNHYAAMLVAAHLGAGWALYAAVRRRGGALTGAAAAIVLLTLGAAQDVVLWPLNVGAPIAVGTGLLGWVAWDTDRPTRRRDALGAGSLLLAVASHPIGIVFLLAAAALVSVHPGKQRLLWPAAIGGLLVAWFLAFGISAQPAGGWVELIVNLPGALNHGLARAVGVLSLVGSGLGLLVAVFAAGAGGLIVGRAVRPGHRFWIALAAGIGVNVLAVPDSAASGGADGAALYASVTLMLVAAVELGRAAWPRLGRWRSRSLALGAGMLWLLLVVVSGIATTDAAAAARRGRAEEIRASLVALQLFAPIAEARGEEVIDSERFGSMTFAQWADVRAVLGSPVPTSVSSITARDPGARQAADRLVLHLFAAELAAQLTESPPAATLPAVFEASRGAVFVDRQRGQCSRFHLEGNDAQVAVALHDGQRLFVRSDGQAQSQIFYRLLSESHQESVSERQLLRTDSWYVISPPRPPGGTGWVLRFDPPQDAQRAELCVTGPAPEPPIRLVLEPVVGGLDAPLGLGHAADGSGRLFVLERAGLVRVVRDGRVSEDPFLDIRDRVTTAGEQGLLGIAFHPDFVRNGRLFVSYTDLAGDLVIVEYTDDAQRRTADPDSERIVLRIPRPTPDHIGGMLAFGPDGYLYISSGDGSFLPGTHQVGMVQDPATLLGVILRIDVDGGGSRPYLLPPDNPRIDPRAPEVWSYGLRNPWRFSFDRQTGDLWIGDVGHTRREEIDFQPADSAGGQNYGWSIMEGSRCYFDAACDQSGLVLPVADYPHSVGGCAVIGGYVYRGRAYPELQGWYLYGDLCSGRIWGMQGWASTPVELAATGSRIASFGEDDEGELYVAAIDDGIVFRVTVEP